MITRDRLLIDQLIKAWAQGHNDGYIIADTHPSNEAMDITSGHLSWVVKEGYANLDLSALADRIELFVEHCRVHAFTEGMFCHQCGIFFQFAEPNLENGSFKCYA